MSLSNRADLGVLTLRLSLGLVLIAHSLYLKLFVFTLPGTAAFFGAIGLPEPLAYVVFAVEAIAGVLLVLGVHPRLAAASVVPVLIGATWAHWPNGWLFTNADGGWEYPALLAVLAFAQTLLGGGALMLPTRHARGAQRAPSAVDELAGAGR